MNQRREQALPLVYRQMEVVLFPADKWTRVERMGFKPQRFHFSVQMPDGVEDAVLLIMEEHGNKVVRGVRLVMAEIPRFVYEDAQLSRHATPPAYKVAGGYPPPTVDQGLPASPRWYAKPIYRQYDRIEGISQQFFRMFFLFFLIFLDGNRQS
jgi:hypothetical protein